MRDYDTIKEATECLAWIAQLNKDNCPGGPPQDMDDMRALLNRVVLDVRKVHKLLSNLQSDRSDKSDKSDSPGLIPTHGGYRNLKGFQVAEIIYDGTVIFCNRFIDRRSRTHDQMVQAARSGRQNIAEGSMASATSKKTELKLTNVAKASLEELLLDYEDFLRQRQMRKWEKDAPESLALRNRHRSFPRKWFAGDLADRTGDELLDPYGLREAVSGVAANSLVCLCNQAIYLLKRQIARLEKDFVEDGGFTEKLYRVRKAKRAGGNRH